MNQENSNNMTPMQPTTEAPTSERKWIIISIILTIIVILSALTIIIIGILMTRNTDQEINISTSEQQMNDLILDIDENVTDDSQTDQSETENELDSAILELDGLIDDIDSIDEELSQFEGEEF